MQWKLLFAVTAIFSINAFAGIFPVDVTSKLSAQCMPNPRAPSATDAHFCAIFPASVGSCARIPHPNVNQMKLLYNVLLGRGSLQAGCNFYAPAGYRKSCYDQWTCYWNGGQSPNKTGNHPGLCDATGVACATMP